MYPPNFIWSHQKGWKLSLAFSILGLYEILSSSFFLVNSCCWPRRRRSFFLSIFDRSTGWDKSWMFWSLYSKKNSSKVWNFGKKEGILTLIFYWIKSKSNFKGRGTVFMQRGRILSKKSIHKCEFFIKIKTLLDSVLNFYSMAEQCFSFLRQAEFR